MIIRFISSILNYILGTCGFLFRHILKASFIDPSSNPKLRFENNKTTLSISTCDVSNLEKDIDSMVNAEMAEEFKTYKPAVLDPYRNPSLVFSDNLFQAKMLNSCKELYLDSKEEYLRRTLCSDIIKQRWQRVEIYIVNTGSIATKPMLVKIHVRGNNLYRGSKVKENSDECYLPPTGTEHFHRDLIVTPDFYLMDSNYKYLTVSGESPIHETITYDINKPIIQGKDNKYLLESFYIDTSETTEIEIEWNIYEDTLGKKGNHGVLKIECSCCGFVTRNKSDVWQLTGRYKPAGTGDGNPQAL